VKLYRLVGPEGAEVLSAMPGTLGGHRRNKIYGRLDCPSALRWLAKGHIVKHRVFFADEATAIAAGYRPCAVCMRDEYRRWKAASPQNSARIPRRRDA
jgi:methylphosphotriester-DNA--protein-cysteine methyltransferase